LFTKSIAVKTFEHPHSIYFDDFEPPAKWLILLTRFFALVLGILLRAAQMLAAEAPK
jgi:hypothetical protein